MVFLLVTALLWTACGSVPLTGRRQVRMLPEGLLSEMAAANYQGFMDQHQVVPSSDPRAQMVQRSGEKISNAVVQYLRESGEARRVQDFDWQFNLVDSEQVNAWAMPGGKIAIYTGILDLTQDENGLAVVMAHEIAHVIARHGNERMSQQLLLTMGAISLDVALRERPQETRDIFMLAFGVGGTLGSLAYSRQHEYEADALGMIFMAMAGYNPNHTITFWERMMAYSSGPDIPQFLSTHPSNQARVNAAREFLPTAMNYYNP
ncbi:MAG: M48 family peptidase [Bacteroidia bacterium]|nr:MAG: M48 family peptidase [Bacteroidia bacterium]